MHVALSQQTMPSTVISLGCLRDNTVPLQQRNVMRKFGYRSYGFSKLYSTSRHSCAMLSSLMRFPYRVWM